MSKKHPFYTALGWTVWQFAKRYARQKAASKVPSRKLLLTTVAVAAVGAVGLAAAGSASSDRA